MKPIITDRQLETEAIRILVRELGYGPAMRFMLHYREGKGDYTKERRKLLKDVTLDQIFANAKQYEAKTPKPKKRRSA